jgi:predicted esterase
MSKQSFFSRIVVVFAIPLLCVSAHAAQSVLTPRQIIDRVLCASDTNQSYALYLPSNYTPEKRWPILYAFDPAARGRIPVERFREAAEKYGWIVVGSNNSRNGPFPAAVAAWNAIMKDTHARWTIDDARIYLTGFSGGARVAVGIAALCQECVAGVIGCGAGFPAGVVPSVTQRFVFFGAVGVDDFNFGEVKGLNEAMSKVGMTHRIHVFTGRHEWTPDTVATEALEWLELQAMKANKRPRDSALIESLWQNRLQQSRTLEESHHLYEAYQSYAGMVDTFDGLKDTTEVKQKVSQLNGSRGVKNAMVDEQTQIKRQERIQDQLFSLIAARNRRSELDSSSNLQTGSGPNAAEPFDPGVRLRATLADLRKQSKVAEDNGNRRVARRVLEGVFVVLFEQGLEALQIQDRHGRAVEAFQLATEVNPDRPGAFYHLAWAHAAKGNKKKSLQALKTAVDKGFADLAAITDNKAFDLIRSDPQYQQIIQSVKTNK